MLLGAGGLSNGSQVAAFLTLGAAGAVLGTRFLLTHESLYSDAQKAALISAGIGSTVRTQVFDRLRGTTDWPQGVDGRALRNATVEDVDAGMDMKEAKRKFLDGVRSGDHSRMLVWAGEGVALMDEVKGAKVCKFTYYIDHRLTDPISTRCWWRTYIMRFYEAYSQRRLCCLFNEPQIWF